MDKAFSSHFLVTEGFGDYRLLDSGVGQKLERFGAVTVIRPEPQAMWPKALPENAWQEADAIFTGGDTGSEESGNWQILNQAMPKKWTCHYNDVSFYGRLTSFRHLGFFPDQAPNWDWMVARVKESKIEAPRVLNLFAYTGVASLLLTKAGATVTHLDASKKAIQLAKENQTLSDLSEDSVRWILDDALKFLTREKRRGKTYHGILLDPPKYGRGPNKEVWELFQNFPELLSLCRDVLDPDALFVVSTIYAMRASFVSLDMAMRAAFPDGKIESGELLVKEESSGRFLSTALYSRWMPA